jgi:hypothetical protein
MKQYVGISRDHSGSMASLNEEEARREFAKQGTVALGREEILEEKCL